MAVIPTAYPHVEDAELRLARKFGPLPTDLGREEWRVEFRGNLMAYLTLWVHVPAKGRDTLFASDAGAWVRPVIHLDPRLLVTIFFGRGRLL